jgi:hypothetical protein
MAHLAGRRVFGRAAILGAVSVTAMAISPAIASVTDFAIIRGGYYEQTGPATTTNIFYYFRSFANVQGAFDYTSATLETPLLSYDMYYVGSSGYWNYSSVQITKTELDTTYTSGLYTLDASNASESVVVSLGYDGMDNYPPPPTLTPMSYNGLSGLDPSGGYTFSFGAFAPPPGYIGTIPFFLSIT